MLYSPRRSTFHQTVLFLYEELIPIGFALIHVVVFPSTALSASQSSPIAVLDWDATFWYDISSITK